MAKDEFRIDSGIVDELQGSTLVSKVGCGQEILHVAQVVHDLTSSCAQEDPNWKGTAPAPEGNLDEPTQ